MRLSKVKLAGFKSFVEPTTFLLTERLSGIVGPNGCGKSNIIDAVRWVMGESSARQLRGSSMSDVIFNGSTHRKPSSFASVELIFDNREGRLGGEWAAFSEISVRRHHDREGGSQYFLNGTRCRRRDITDIFMGTGLGPRSYAIIEQGMISRIVESKPEELRTFLEEAAAISKYKEQRKETARRIENTRENLSRLTDIRVELGTQLEKLEEQAKVAEAYRSLKREERHLRYWQMSLEKHSTEEERRALSEKGAAKGDQFQKLVEAYNQQSEAILEQERALESAEAALLQLRTDYYQKREEEQRLEHELRLLQELLARDSEQYREWQTKREALLADQKRLQSVELPNFDDEESNIKIVMLEEEILQLESTLEERTVQLEALKRGIEEAREKQQQLLQRESRLIQMEESLTEAIVKSEEQLSQWQKKGEKGERDDSEEGVVALALLEEELLIKHEASLELEAQLLKEREGKREIESTLNQLRQQGQKLSETRSSLEGKAEALRSVLANIREKGGEVNGEHPSLFESIEVDEPYRKGVSALLDPWLSLPLLKEQVAEISRYFIAEKAEAVKSPHADLIPLMKHISSPPDLGLERLLGHIYLLREGADLPTLQRELSAREWILTQNGMLYGRNWGLSLADDMAQASGLLQYQAQLRQLEEELGEVIERSEELSEEIDQLEEQQRAKSAALQGCEEQYQSLQREVEALERNFQLTEQEMRYKAAESKRLEEELKKLKESLLTERQTLERTKEERVILQEEIEQGAEALAIFTQQLNQQEATLGEENRALEAQKRALLTAQHHRSQERAHLLHHQQEVERVAQALKEVEERLEKMHSISDHHLQIEEREVAKVIAEEARIAAEEATLLADQEVATLKKGLQNAEERKGEEAQKIEALREEIQDFALKEEALKTKESLLQEEWKQLLANLKEGEQAILDANFKENPLSKSLLKRELTRVKESIREMGAVNLVAIEEAKTLRERKEYLDAQDHDLNSALATLEAAIREIDQETKERFMQTFNQVNEGFSQLFPELFGGGSAELTLTEPELMGEDGELSGVNIIAHPPGKKPGTIHLLSGGEKALTAMALVFSIFNLNPAPFCMLDEVDAPLDEANVRRLGALINKMSEKVQFIFITHNKTTMSISDALIGVTMAEPGASRLVSVNLQEALEFAEEAH